MHCFMKGGDWYNNICSCCSVSEIADMFEEDETLIQRICDIKQANPDSNEEK